MLAATRVLQGVGGAMMVPVGRLAVLRTTAKPTWCGPSPTSPGRRWLAPVVAPALGGVLATYASWRWIFLVNVPLGVVGLLLARRLVPVLRADGPPRLDWRGFVLAAPGIAALVVALENMGGGAIGCRSSPGQRCWRPRCRAGGRSPAARAGPLLDLRMLRVRSYGSRRRAARCSGW